MYIQTNDKYPVVEERNKKIDVPRSVAEVAIYNRTATIALRARRGTNLWLEEMAAIEAKRVPNPLDTNPTVTSNLTSGGWAAVKLKLWGGVVVIKKVGPDEIRFEVPPPDCPPHIVAQYNDLKGSNDGANREEIERVKREQDESKFATQKLW
jgi:hypothetical protein